MLSYFNRLKSKKGFTLIELIVVIAIIGVLLVMILPAMTGSNKDKIGKGVAKDFFYRVQDVMCEAKMSNADAFSGSTFAADNEVVFFADINMQGSVTETGILRNTNNSSNILKLNSSYVTSNTSAYDEAFVRTFEKFSQNAEKYVTNTDNMTGTVYAVVAAKDRQLSDGRYITSFSVQAAYWSDIPAADITTAGTVDITLEKDNILFSGYYCCAYPEALSLEGEVMYKYD